MSQSGDKKEHLELHEGRVDSGTDSFSSLTGGQYERYETNEEREKGLCLTDDRVDSAYTSSSYLSTGSFEELFMKCMIGNLKDYNDTDAVPYTEEEVELLTTLTEDGDTVLHLAIIHEEQSFAHQLIELFPQDLLDLQNNLYQTPLHLATYLDQPVIVKELLAKGASLELQDKEGNNPLHVACEHGLYDCANEMVSAVTSDTLDHVLEMQNWRGLTCLHVTTLHKQHRLMRLLMKKGADLNIQEGTSGKCALHMAVELHDDTAVTSLLNKGANVDAVMFNGCTALHLAVGRQYATIANLLCQAGADKMIRNLEDETALDLADGNDDILALFPFDDIQIMGRTVLNF